MDSGRLTREFEFARRIQGLEETGIPFARRYGPVEQINSGGGSSSSFTGTAYIAGRKTTGLGTKAWVRVFLDTATAEDHDGPPPDPFPPNEEWYEVAQTFGNIHVPRA
jgi:hypothetical protein